MNLTDTHCHLDLEAFDADRGEVLDRARSAGLTRILIPGLDLASSKRAVALARQYPELYAAIGIHPNDSLGWNADTLDVLRQFNREDCTLSTRRKIVAIGEIGLDYYWNNAPHDHQRFVLAQQLKLAAELNLPVVLHMREQDDAPEGNCASDMVDILTDWTHSLRHANLRLAERPGVLHSFSGSLCTAQKMIEQNFCIGITGPITYKNAEVKRQVVKSLPLDRILIETDAPFLAPVPKRGLRNEPAFVCHITDKIAEIHIKHPEEIAALTTANAARIFSWGG